MKIKQFNLEEAKDGAKIVTRDNRSIRIICYDKNNGKNHTQNIIALLKDNTYPFDEKVIIYDLYGKYFSHGDSGLDLFIVEEDCDNFILNHLGHKFKVGSIVYFNHNGNSRGYYIWNIKAAKCTLQNVVFFATPKECSKNKKTKLQLSIEKAFQDGKVIESRRINYNDPWTVNLSPGWNWNNHEYRIKKDPEYIPFTIEDVTEHLLKKGIKDKKTGSICLLGSTKIPTELSLKDIFDHFTFLDDTPVGKIKE